MQPNRNPKQFHRPQQRPQPGPTPGDTYLLAASAARVPVAVYLTTGEVLTPALIKQVHTYTLLIEVGSAAHLVSKSAIVRVSPAQEEQK